MKKACILVLYAIIVLGVCAQMIVIFYFFNGSLELFPTEERQGAVRITCGLLVFLLFVVELMLWKLIRRIRSN